MTNFNFSEGKNKKTFKTRSTSRNTSSDTLKTSLAYTQKIDGSNSSAPVFEIDPLLYPRFESTQTYDPFDFSLTSVKMKLQANYNGPVSERSFGDIKDPLDLWKRPDILNEFVTHNGKIVQGAVVGNKGKTHKRISKAIRRSRAAGLMPYFHKSSLFQ